MNFITCDEYIIMKTARNKIKIGDYYYSDINGLNYEYQV